ncbi:MAG TPA: site-specific DNA-methyltransferase [Accumulibacter sp.]|nr:site-specific DNA-methyltransferase [Accumulibacter sp.]HMW18113.1 site-specific DNA-methyltransferase [Accumulibacter sp.]HMX21928.1 site-specific DNA-methyltransferase [Accumulibacter sp.]HMY07663.1 site-specific DNA-methyltransferase [Accumulibacter sp.]HNC16895.1 site-specific DNA-methyltransferase [Accumulibacter sp.]
MPTLNWIGKEAVVKHHQDVPFRLLEPVPDLSCGDAVSGNLIVQGDNLHALKALLPRYAGQVKCIYIDPPYNTGNEGWVYNDNVNSPEIRKWLGETVGKEGETLDRHDRWLCMMYPRLVLLKRFLREDGAIFVSIDDNEVATLRLVMDEIFGPRNFVATVLWQKVYSPKNSARHLSEDHDYIVVYAAKADRWKPNLLGRTDEQNEAYKNLDNDPRGIWKTSDLSARNYYGDGTYSVTSPSGRVIEAPPKGRYWTVSKARFQELDRDNRIWWGKKGDSIPQLKRFLSDVKDGVVPQTMWFYKDVGHTQEAKKELIELVDFDTSDDVFITPKPTRLIQRILQIATDKDSIILDSFAGSGTTGHSVLKQNVEDDGCRRFIQVEMLSEVASAITAGRAKRAISGYTNAKGQAVKGLGGGFQFCRLSAEPLFDADGQIRRDVGFAQLAEFVWFVETGTGLDAPMRDAADSPLLGIHEGRAVYLLYNGILKDHSVAGGNVLTGPVLDALPGFAGPKVIYAAACRLGGARLARGGITFKQTPYALEV